jgi:hypothetical protein
MNAFRLECLAGGNASSSCISGYPFIRPWFVVRYKRGATELLQN